MENISNLEEFRSYIKTKEFWADTWSISTIERLLNIKIIMIYKQIVALDSDFNFVKSSFRELNFLKHLLIL